MKWINSTGGPLILIPTKELNLWSGIGTIEGAKNNEFIEAENFMDPSTCHYGLACSSTDEIWETTINENSTKVIILGDEPLEMTIVSDKNKDCFYVIRWCYGESEKEVEAFIDTEDFSNLTGWESLFETEMNEQYYSMLDSSICGIECSDEDCLSIEIKNGLYSISTIVYEPNSDTSLILQQFKLM